MVGLVPDEGSRRRLPQWMLGVSADEQVRKYDNVEETNINLEGGFVSQAACSQKKTSTVHPGKDCVLCRKDKSLKKSHCLSKCNSKRRKRKSKQQDADCDSNIPETLPEEENGFGVKVPAGRKRRKTKFSAFGNEQLEVQPSSDDDVELTVEDLMNISEEYVRTDKNMEQGQASNRKCESETRLPTTVSHTNKSKGFVDDHICDRPSSTHNISASYKSNSSLKGEQTVINAGITGDPARPLLKKPLEEKKTEFVMEDAAFCSKFELQNHNKVVIEEIGPTMKKKSSLKDKPFVLVYGKIDGYGLVGRLVVEGDVDLSNDEEHAREVKGGAKE
ncbi:hypothetical protein FNV43_RR26499 [Rhamnella rubrinervis]|uniref:Uncharacterized protein n=1 Tax=Rhamnella rubrinervis TaxID=2594499 RepID=A0A8K0DPF0_9ROSA|nr:hypothetical protein FNV43_RR26499 [Rhamnella rubrinervis]